MAIPVSVYVHLPWCVKKCPYCDFNSHALSHPLNEDHYITTLIRDWQTSREQLYHRPIGSIFFGGGTPSLFSARAIGRFLETLSGDVSLNDIEITLEANPGTLEHGRFQAYKAAGINRISLGVQSFNDKHLSRLGRIHGAKEAYAAIDELYRAGLDNFNIDLMHGLPTQSVAEALDDLNKATAAQPTHLSWYQLTLEPHTLFYAKQPTLPSEDVLERIEQAGAMHLKDAGLKQYEVSAYARDNETCWHNLNYWHFGDYVGLGAGAHSKITHPDTGEIVRIVKQKHPTLYGASTALIMSQKTVDKEALPLEFMMNALRLNAGWTRALFEARTGLPFHTIEKNLAKAIGANLLIQEGDTIRASDLGRRYLNDLIGLFELKHKL